MPEYQYKCKECGTKFSIVKSMTDAVTTFCPNCRSSQVQQQYFAPKVVYKGKGFYTTDNKKSEPLTNIE